MAQDQSLNWLPCFLVAYKSIASAGSNKLTISIDNSIKFKCEYLTGFAHTTGSGGTVQYFTLDGISLGRSGKQVIYGTGIHSSFFSRSANTSALNFSFETEFDGNNVIIIDVTTLANTTDVFIVLSGKQVLANKS